MSSSVPRRSPPPGRSSGGERVFTDEAGRLWSAALHPAAGAAAAAGARPGLVLVFACISDARQPMRAVAAADPALLLAGGADDDDLRRWLRQAPAMGRLT